MQLSRPYSFMRGFWIDKEENSAIIAFQSFAQLVHKLMNCLRGSFLDLLGWNCTHSKREFGFVRTSIVQQFGQLQPPPLLAFRLSAAFHCAHLNVGSRILTPEY